METRIADCPLGAKCEEVKEENGRQVLYRCPWYIKLQGNDVNTGAPVDQWGCAIAWMPGLMINTANETRKTTAATESFRNEVIMTERMKLHLPTHAHNIPQFTIPNKKEEH